MTGGDTLSIIYPGHYNFNQGPDFFNAKIRIGKTLWAGTVELHILASDWDRHRHENDKNYRNVILHVVWENDRRSNAIPVLELKTRVPKILLQRYSELMSAASFIPCEKNISTTPGIIWKSWKERLLAERLLRKSAMVKQYLLENNNHWEETFWWLLCRSFGMKVNADAFEAIGRSIPLKLFSKFTTLYQCEALLFGQAGLLHGTFKDEYVRMLKKEYKFQQAAYKLQPVYMPLLFLRMRPGNFPTLRLAQLAMLVHQSAHLFSKIKEAISVQPVRQWFDIPAGEYWNHHYRFGEPSSFKIKRPGTSMIDSIIINTVVPVLFAWGSYHSDEACRNRALQWLDETAAETNSIVSQFWQRGIRCKTSYDSQALIELKHEYCDHKRCLDCAVGNFLLKSQS